MEKATLEDAITVAFRADMVDRSPPNTMTATPKAGMKPSAARTMAVSPYSPRNCQEGWPSGPEAAARETKRIRRYMTTVMAREMKVARGMVFSGSLISSATVAMRSYPSKAMNVSPIATMTPPNPWGKNGEKLAVA